MIEISNIEESETILKLPAKYRTKLVKRISNFLKRIFTKNIWHMKAIKSKNDNDINTTKKEDTVIKPVLDTPKKSGLINEFLWSCAGVNKHILRQCPSDYAKYAGIGGTILFTAIMAALSGGYALNFVFKDIYISIAFGIFWGLLIFNLDRFIVNTMYSDGKHTISLKELGLGSPRIVIAIFLLILQQ